MTRDARPDGERGHREVEEPVLESIQRRDLLKASAATGAAGMLAGCVGGLGGTGTDSPQGATEARGECPKVEGVKNGFVWVQKTTTIWASTLVRDGEEVLDVSGDGNRVGFSGRGNIGQGKLEFHEPGSYEFQYRVDPNGLTWVEEPTSLISVLYPTEPWDENGVVRAEDVVRWSVYPYERDYPLSMSFEIDEPGTYRVAYGPANGNFLVEEWLPEVTERTSHLRLGLNVEADDDAYSWVFPEIPQHVWVWSNGEELILNAGHEVRADCELSEPIP